MAESYISELGDSLSHGVANTNGDRVKIIAPKLYNDGNGNHPSIATALAGKVSKSGDTMTGGLEIQGVKSGTSYANSGGGYNANYNNIILRGDPTYGTSGILFTSSKGTTSINQATDRGFIQFHSMGVTPVAEGSTPTMSSSGEANSLVIGVGNDGDDEVWIQTPATNGIKHVVGPTKYTVYDGANLPAATSASAVATTSSAGSASSFSRGDHVHSISLATGDSDGQVKIAGSNVNVAGWDKVTQTADDTTASSFEVLLSNTADNTDRTETARKSSKLKFTPSTGTLSIGGPISRNLGGSATTTIAETNILTIDGSTDGSKITYQASTGDLGITRFGTVDDANAKLSLGNWVSSTYKEAISIVNGSATVIGSLTGNATKVSTTEDTTNHLYILGVDSTDSNFNVIKRDTRLAAYGGKLVFYENSKGNYLGISGGQDASSVYSYLPPSGGTMISVTTQTEINMAITDNYSKVEFNMRKYAGVFARRETPIDDYYFYRGLATTYNPSDNIESNIHAGKYTLSEKCTLQFNTTTNALDFVFA